MTKSNLISGIFVDREAGDLENEIVEISDEDLTNFLKGHYALLTSRKITYLKELQDDPYGTKWDAAHADYIFIEQEAFFQFLFVHFPTWESWEKNYQDLRALVGPHPINWCNAMIAVKQQYN